MAQAAVLVPSIKETVTTLLKSSAQAAAQSCSGDTNGTVCGQKWYVGGYDGSTGVGQQLSALETVQGLLLLQGNASTPEQPPIKQPELKTSATQSEIKTSTTMAGVKFVTRVSTATTITTSYIYV